MDSNRGKEIGALMQRSIVMVVDLVLDGRGTTGSIHAVELIKSGIRAGFLPPSF